MRGSIKWEPEVENRWLVGMGDGETEGWNSASFPYRFLLLNSFGNQWKDRVLPCRCHSRQFGHCVMSSCTRCILAAVGLGFLVVEEWDAWGVGYVFLGRSGAGKGERGDSTRDPG